MFFVATAAGRKAVITLSLQVCKAETSVCALYDSIELITEQIEVCQCLVEGDILLLRSVSRYEIVVTEVQNVN